jgi:DNA-binding XRE family transcriptional regulator
MANISILRGKIVERDTTQEAVASKMHINRSTFYRKMKENGKSFTVEEVQKLAHVLNLTCEDVMKIFFTM